MDVKLVLIGIGRKETNKQGCATLVGVIFREESDRKIRAIRFRGGIRGWGKVSHIV